MYPDRDTLSNVPSSEYITVGDQSMVESGVTEGGKNTASFLLACEQALLFGRAALERFHLPLAASLLTRAFSRDSLRAPK